MQGRGRKLLKQFGKIGQSSLFARFAETQRASARGPAGLLFFKRLTFLGVDRLENEALQIRETAAKRPEGQYWRLGCDICFDPTESTVDFQLRFCMMSSIFDERRMATGIPCAGIVLFWAACALREHHEK